MRKIGLGTILQEATPNMMNSKIKIGTNEMGFNFNQADMWFNP